MISNFKLFVVSWILMWAMTYIVVPFVAYNILPQTPGWFYEVYGWLIVATLMCLAFRNPKIKTVGSLLLFILVVLQVESGVQSWTGAAVWNVPFASKEIFQVSMAFADLVAAVFMIWLLLSEITETKLWRFLESKT